jgi:hypothetical protein
MLIITILFRYLPFISMWEIAEEQHIELDPIIPAVEKSKN